MTIGKAVDKGFLGDCLELAHGKLSWAVQGRTRASPRVAKTITTKFSDFIFMVPFAQPCSDSRPVADAVGKSSPTLLFHRTPGHSRRRILLRFEEHGQHDCKLIRRDRPDPGPVRDEQRTKAR